MEIVIRGKPKEIADLVREVQGQLDLTIGPEKVGNFMDLDTAVQAICDSTREAPEQSYS